MSKFFLGRAAVLGVVSKAEPRCVAQASGTCAGVFATLVAIAKTTGSFSIAFQVSSKVTSWS